MTGINLLPGSALLKKLTAPVHIAPLVVFRIIFGGMMFAGIVRFALNGWINDLYIQPVYYFSYYGFEWVKPLGANGMYWVFGIMALSSFLLMLGLWYRVAAAAFFITFTYVELIDKSNYLNHYYFISIVAFLMILLPAAGYFSLDIAWRGKKQVTQVPRLFITTIQLQLGIVYFLAGVAKLNYDWLIQAMPLRIWLPPHTNMPVIGFLFDKWWVAYLFSWFGAVYDLSIPFLLAFRKTRGLAYFLVIVFHVVTYLLFQIGMFPFIMILSTLIFFSEDFHLRVINGLQKISGGSPPNLTMVSISDRPNLPVKKALLIFLSVHFIIQVLLPFRYALYPGKLFWTEQGFRFSWRVMLMEKAGKAFFYVTDKATGRSGEAMVSDYLTPNQEKMMATQPDMILQFAHFLGQKYQEQGIANPEIRVECYVTLNGSGSRLFIDKTIDLTKQKDGFQPKNWILPFEEK